MNFFPIMEQPYLKGSASRKTTPQPAGTGGGEELHCHGLKRLGSTMNPHAALELTEYPVISPLHPLHPRLVLQHSVDATAIGNRSYLIYSPHAIT